MNSRSFPITALASAALLMLGGCGSPSSKSQATTIEASRDTLTEAIAASSNLSVIASALGQTGLAQVFDGAGAYTIFAPTDAAFKTLGTVGDELRKPDQTAALAAVLRDHVVPGYLTPADIEAAIASKGGSVKVDTMGDHSLTFSQSADGIEVTSEDGSSAHIAGAAIKASNGVAIPLDGVLKKLDSDA